MTGNEVFTFLLEAQELSELYAHLVFSLKLFQHDPFWMEFSLQQFCFINIANMMSTFTLCLISQAILAGCVEATSESILCPYQ